MAKPVYIVRRPSACWTLAKFIIAATALYAVGVFGLLALLAWGLWTGLEQ